MRRLLCLLLVVLLPVSALADTTVRAKALLKNSAVLEINGTERFLKQGQTSPEGVTLVSASSREARIRVDGAERVLTLSRHIGAPYQPASKAEVRLMMGAGGHYLTGGRINGRAADMMVDTGATLVAMSEVQARALGIRLEGTPQSFVTTASGRASSWQVMLDSVAVGSVLVNKVPAVVIAGNYPEIILLGNSFLDKTDYNREQGVLVIRSRY